MTRALVCLFVALGALATAAGRHQLVMRALLDDPAVVHEQD